MAEKTEKATPKKLRDARKKGQVAKSQDLPSAFTFITSITLILGMSGWLYDKIGGFTVNLFGLIPMQNLDKSLGALYAHGLITIFEAAMPILVIVSFVGILVNFLAIGPVFATEVFKFDPQKFNPVTNLKQKFKMKTLLELLKSLFKITVAAYLIYGVMYKSLPVLTQAVKLNMFETLLIFKAFLIEVLVKVGLFFIVVAVIDFVLQKQLFAKEMKMEKFEVKQEYKNTEGDPQIKGKRKQIAQEIAYSDAPAAAIRQSNALITNPTHLAIAVAYERGVDAAPFVTTMAKDHQAENLIKLALRYNVPVVRNIKLAHRLWEGCGEFEFVPEDTYKALAEILRWVAALNTEDEYELELSED
jgi:type III secretion protein U